MSHHDRERTFGETMAEAFSGGIFFITLGIVFLLNTTGVLPWELWGVLWRFWPLILVSVGLHLIFARNVVARVIIGFLVSLTFVVVVIISALLVSPGNQQWLETNLPWWQDIDLNLNLGVGSEQVTNQSVDIADFPNVDSLEVRVSIGSQQFNITEEASSKYLDLTAHHFENYGVPELTSELDGQNLSVDFRTKESNVIFATGKASYDFTLGQTDLDTSLMFDIGSGSGQVTLGQPQLEQFSVDLGSGSLQLSLEEAAVPRKLSTVDVGSGSLTINLPEDIGLRIDHQIGSGRLRAFDTSINDDGTYYSDNYDTATKVLRLDVTVGSGSLIIE